MSWNRCRILLVILSVSLTGCLTPGHEIDNRRNARDSDLKTSEGSEPFTKKHFNNLNLETEKKNRAIDDRRYARYSNLNTIEGYNQFIKKYPDNLNVEAAKKSIATLSFAIYENKDTIEGITAFLTTYPNCKPAQKRLHDLQYAPFKKKDTIEGYRKFINKYPQNYRVVDAERNWAKCAYNQVEKQDTIDGYRAYLVEHPGSNFDCEAKRRIHELSFNALGRRLEKEYEFDLLLYRLHLKRHRKHLYANGKTKPAEFICDASITSHNGGIHFQTQLLYPNESYPLAASEDNSNKIYDDIISEALYYLVGKFKKKTNIAGFGFEVSVAPFGFCKTRNAVVTYFIPKDLAILYIRKQISKKALVTGSEILRQGKFSPSKP